MICRPLLVFHAPGARRRQGKIGTPVLTHKCTTRIGGCQTGEASKRVAASESESALRWPATRLCARLTLEVSGSHARGMLGNGPLLRSILPGVVEVPLRGTAAFLLRDRRITLTH